MANEAPYWTVLGRQSREGRANMAHRDGLFALQTYAFSILILKESYTTSGNNNICHSLFQGLLMLLQALSAYYKQKPRQVKKWTESGSKARGGIGSLHCGSLTTLE